MTAFQIHQSDNVATALEKIEKGKVLLRGDAKEPFLEAIEEIPDGHKIAVRDIREGESILKYGVVIGKAVKNIKKGSWVHLHNIRSVYDERSSHLDLVTGAPKDVRYE